MIIISLTSIPSRFQYLPRMINDLLKQRVDQVLLSIPYKYNRFPDAEVTLPPSLYAIEKENERFVINRCSTDYGPGTMYMAPALSSKADLVVVVNDDTWYPPNLVSSLLEAYKKDNCCWALSGFVIDEYVSTGGVPKRWNEREIDVTESYGGVLLENKWLRDMVEDFPSMYEITYNDDIIIGNMLSKMGVKKKTLCTDQCNISHIKQYQFGMLADALFQNNGDGSHYKNNCKVFREIDFKKLKLN